MEHVDASWKPTMYYCIECRAVYDWQSRCPECNAVASMRPWPPRYVEPEAVEAPVPGSHRKKLSELQAVKKVRIQTGEPGMDRVLGDDREQGFVRPSVVLFGGGQGAGKSSLALQAVAGVNPKLKVQYLLNEEPDDRLLDRAARLGFKQEALGHIYICYSPFLADYRAAVKEDDPDIIVVDSLSMLTDPPDHGGEDTADEQANRMRYAKYFFDEANNNNRTILLISHLNKENEISGVRKIQYLLDAIMTIRKISKKYCVLECPEKNRFGEPGVPVFYEIGRGGLQQVEREEAESAAAADAAPKRRRDEDGPL